MLKNELNRVLKNELHLPIVVRVGFVKLKAETSLVHKDTHFEKRIPGICFLRGDAVAILVALVCEEGDSKKVYSILVDQPR